MEQVASTLTVFFEGPYWVGICERRTDETRYEVCKITFGPEPKDYEVYAFLLENIKKLRFSPSIEAEAAAPKQMSPKRMQRAVNRQLQTVGVGTKAQQALQLQHEQCKLERKVRSKEEKEADKERRFELRQEKRREKHKGR